MSKINLKGTDSSRRNPSESSIARLSKNLFDKIERINSQVSIPSTPQHDLYFSHHMAQNYDSLTELLQRAQNLAIDNHNKIVNAKKKISSEKVVSKGQTFLTDTGIAEREGRSQKLMSGEEIRQEIPEEPSQSQILKNLIEKQNQDDLSQLRRMIRQTDKNINQCQRKVTKTHKNIMNYVEKTYDDKHIKQEYSKRLAKIGLR